MNEDANVQIVRSVYERFQAGDIRGFIDLCDTDVDWNVPEIEDSPFSGYWYGRDSVSDFFEMLAGAQDITHFEAREYIAQGDKVVVIGRLTATVRATGRHFSTEWVTIFTLRNAKLASLSVFFDTAAALRAFQKAHIA